VIYIIALSFIPLIHQTLIAQSSWLGYGTGAYAFQSPSYFVLFNDPYDGSSKPNIHVNPTFAPNERISLIEFSDWTSYVDGFNLFNDFNMTIRVSASSPKILDATYTRPGLVLDKLVDVSSPECVVVKIIANKEVTAHIEMWKWVLTSVNGITRQNATKPTLLAVSTEIDFTFNDQSIPAQGVGSITLSRVPTQIEVWPFEAGFNRVTVDFINSEMTFTVSGSITANQQSVLSWNYPDLPYLLPIIAIVVVAIYILVERHGQKNKDHTERARD
jgi:hypothetical protein